MSLLLLLLLLLLLVCLLPGFASATNATCPYDLDAATRMVQPACYANATATSATGCCWFVSAAFLYAATRHANLTGAAFLPAASTSSCVSAFSLLLRRRGLVRPSLLSSSSCTLDSSTSTLAADSAPCLYPTVAAVRSAVDLSLPTRLCTAPSVDLAANQSSCTDCQNAVIAAVFTLLNLTGSKEFVPCGMAATLAVWSAAPPPLPAFQSYVLCMVQVLENVGSLSTNNLLPFTPSPSTSLTAAPAGGSPMTVKVAVGCASAAAAALVTILCIVIAIRRRQPRAAVTTIDGEIDVDPAVMGLPTEGLYIFTEAELKRATNGYDERRLLGEGGAGKVYLGRLPSGHHVAVKLIYKARKLGEFYREVEILAKLRHRNLATLVGYCLGHRDRHALVYEYMAGGNLAKSLHTGELTWRRRVAIAADVAEGIVYLHEFPEGAVVHRDVKPTNVLLSTVGGGGTAKLSDFGVSRMVPAGGSHVSTEVKGTMGYVDPDSFNLGHVSGAADVYSFGVMMLELVTGMRAVVPTPSGGAESIVHAARGAMAGVAEEKGVGTIVDARLGKEWDRATVGAIFEVACRCVLPYKEERPTMTEVLVVLKRAIVDLDERVPVLVEAMKVDESEFSDPSTSRMATTGGSTPSAGQDYAIGR